MRISSITRHRAGTTFVFVFFIVFLFCNILLVPKILNVYNGIYLRAQQTHAQTIALEYISGVLKRSDSFGSISVIALEDLTTALSVVKDGKTWLYYCKDGYLYVQNAKKSERSAERLCEAGKMHFSISNNMLSVQYLSPSNTLETLILTPRCKITEVDNETTEQNQTISS